MYENRLRAESFGNVAELYDRVRPVYPPALLDALLADGPRTVLDIGSGTGIAARLLAARGARVLGVEPDPRMAEVARSHGLDVEVATFERWDAAGRRFDLLTAGQAWHWVEPERGAAKAAAVLEARGRICVFWNLGDLPPEVRGAFGPIYTSLEPELEKNAVKVSGGQANVDAAVAAIATVGAFEPATVRVFPWSASYDAAGWRELLATHSDHLTLPAPRRERLLDAIGEAIEGLGGSIVMPYRATLVQARRLS